MYYLIDFCRLCLSFEGEFSNMWLDDIMEKVTTCISELDFDSNLPLLICSSCLEKMEDFFVFRNQCLQSEFLINGYLSKLLNSSHDYKRFASTILKVNLIKDFGTSNKRKGNIVKLRKSSSGGCDESNLCNVYLRDFLKPCQISNTSVTRKDLSSSIEKETMMLCNRSQMEYLKSDISNLIDNVELDIKPDILSNNHDDTRLSSLKPVNYVVSEIINIDENDVFVEEEEEDYNNLPEPGGLKLYKDNIADNLVNESSQLVATNLDLHDPENLLVSKGQERIFFDVQTDVSERVKLRRRNAQIKLADRLNNTQHRTSKRDMAKKSTSGSKKSHTKKSKSKIVKDDQSKNETINQHIEKTNPEKSKPKKSQARKSTTSKLKKGKVKISSANRDLWKAACRNWTLQRMQTSGHVSTGSRSSPNTVRDPKHSEHTKSLSPSNTEQVDGLDALVAGNNKTGEANSDLANLAIATTVVYHDDSAHGEDNSENIYDNTDQQFSAKDDYGERGLTDTSIIPPVRLPRIKTVKELNDLLEIQHQRFSEKLSSEYGIIIEDDKFTDISVESSEDSLKLPSLQEISINPQEFQTPQILNTFSLNDENMWDEPGEQIVMKNEAVLELNKNLNNLNKRVTVSSTYSDLLEQNFPNLEAHSSVEPDNMEKEQTFYSQPVLASLETSSEVCFGTKTDKKTSKPGKKVDISENRSFKLKPLTVLKDKQHEVNAMQQDSHVTDFEGVITAHLINSNLPENFKEQIPVNKSPKMVIKPLSALKPLKLNRTPTKYKIKTTNNIVLFDSEKITPNMSSKHPVLYKSNFGNILEHYLQNSTLHLSTAVKDKSLVTIEQSTNNKEVFTNPPVEPSNETTLTDSPIGTFMGPSLLENDATTKTTPNNSSEDASSFRSNLLGRLKAESSETVEVITVDVGAKSTEVIVIDDSPPPSHCSVVDEEFEFTNSSTSWAEKSIDSKNESRNLECNGSDSLNTESQNEKDMITKSVESSSSPLGFFSLESDKSQKYVKSKPIDDSSRHGVKRASNSDDIPCSPKNARASSEESDALVIDDSLNRSKTPDEIELPELPEGPCVKLESIRNLSGDDDSTVVAADFSSNFISHKVKNTKASDLISKFDCQLDMVNAGLHFDIDGNSSDRKYQLPTNDKDCVSAALLSSTSGSDHFKKGKLSPNFESLIQGLESPPSSPRTSKKKTKRHFRAIGKRSAVLSSVTSETKDLRLLSKTKTDRGESTERSLLQATPQCKENFTLSGNLVTTASQQLTESVLPRLPREDISSDSDSSYVDVEAISGDDELPLIVPKEGHSLYYKQMRCDEAREQRLKFTKHLRALYNEIEENHLSGKHLNSVLKSAKNYIDSLKSKSDVLDNEYHYLKTKHEYLLQSISQLKRDE